MNDVFFWMLDHKNLTWFLFLAPLFTCMIRFAVLEGRDIMTGSHRQNKWIPVVGLMPILNIPVALLCVLVTLVEVYQRLR